MTPDEILQGIQRVLAELPAAPPNPMTVVIPHRTWAWFQAYRLYWQLRDEGVNWRRAKRLRRKEYERLLRELDSHTVFDEVGTISQETLVSMTSRFQHDGLFYGVIEDHPTITDYLAKH